MPKAILEFNLPEEQAEFDLAVNGDKYRIALEDLRDVLRTNAKHREDQATTWEAVRELFWETMKEAGVELD